MSRPQRLALGAAVVVAALLAAELVLRIAGHEPLEGASGPRGLFVADDAADVVLAANFRGRLAETGVTVHTDGRGLRIAEGDPPQPTGREVVLSLGDSIAFGHGVRGSETCAALIERRLGVTVHDAGVPGHGLRQMRAMFTTLAPELAPDVVLFTFPLVGEALDDERARRTARAGLLLSRADAAEIDASRWKTFALHHSRVALLATAPWMRAERRGDGASHFVADLAFLARERSPDVTARLAASATAIRALLEDARARGVAPVLVTVPRAWQVDDALWAELTATNAIDAAAFDRDALRPFLDDLTRRSDLWWIDLTASFRTAGVGREAFLDDHRHLSARGHEIAADAITEFLLEHGIVSERED